VLNRRNRAHLQRARAGKPGADPANVLRGLADECYLAAAQPDVAGDIVLATPLYRAMERLEAAAGHLELKASRRQAFANMQNFHAARVQ
jgi:hypothetical protein